MSDERDGADEEDDGDAAAGGPATDMDLLEALDDRHEHDSEERADVEDLQLFHQVPGKGEGEDDGEEEEDVAVHLLLLFGRLHGGYGGVGRRRLAGPFIPRMQSRLRSGLRRARVSLGSREQMEDGGDGLLGG